MRKHNAEHAAPLPTITRSTDATRAHAFNWALGVTALALCALLGIGVLGWVLLDLSIPSDVVWLILLAPIAGIMAGAIKLIQFTGEHRRFLYELERTLDMDIDQDGEIGKPEAGQPPSGSFLMCPDGVRRRLDTELGADEIGAVKRLLLASDKATVRALTGVVGDKASALRQELIALGICAEPEHKRAAAMLTEGGRRAVRRW